MDYSGKIIRKTPVVPTQQSASGVWTLDDALQATKSNTWPIANVPDPISRSLRFRSSASAYLNRTPATTTNQKTFTWSSWNKLGALGTYRSFFSSATTNPPFVDFSFQNNDVIQLDIRLASGTYQPKTTAVFRDPSAWYHIVVAIDTTQATEANRVKLYVNGVQQTLSTIGVPQNSDLPVNTTVVHNIGRRAVASDSYLDGYLTEVNFIDGQALTPSSFGGTNAVTGVWEPRPYTGTYGTNGFLLTFSDITSTATLGNDTSGNSNNWTTNNISLTAGSTYDSMLDVPTQWIGYNTGDVASVTRGNYAVLNPVDKNSATSITEANLKITATSGWCGVRATFSLPSTGKYYWEALCNVRSSGAGVGLLGTSAVITGDLGAATTGYIYNSGDGAKYNNGSSSAYGATWGAGDLIGIAWDADTGTLSFYKNGTSQGTAYSGLTNTYSPAIGVFGSDAMTANFGQRPFAYTPPAGFRSLCTTNLPSPTILQGNQYFDATTFTSNNTSDVTVVNAGGFAPDLVWYKDRATGSTWHTLVDKVRGNNLTLSSNQTDQEYNILDNGYTGRKLVLNSNGFTINDAYNAPSTDAMIGWQWKANGTGVTNTAGSITSTVSANTTAGFSVVTYTGTGANATVGHGLGVAPRMMIVKSRSASGTDWVVYHASLTSPASTIILLNSTSASLTSPTITANYWNGGTTSTTFGISTANGINTSSATYVAYCFSEVAGYSKFGSYTGNGSADGTFVYTGFRPRWIMVKAYSSAGSAWEIIDTARDTYNITNDSLRANSSAAEVNGTYPDILSNGFKARSAEGYFNDSGVSYIFMAFAENPFKNALAR